MLIQDCLILDNLQVLSENTGPNATMKIRGTFQRADELNANKRRYKKELFENSLSKLRPLVEGRMLLGELDHPEASLVRLGNASHLITSLKMKGNEMVGEAEILNTPAGKIVQTLIKDNVKIGISSRGTGTVTENRDGTKDVNEDFKLITFDIVADPSTRGAYAQLAESKKLDMKATIRKTFGEKVFLTLLKESLEEKPDEKSVEKPIEKKKSYWKDRKEREKKSPQNFKRGYTGKDISNYTETKDKRLIIKEALIKLCKNNK